MTRLCHDSHTPSIATVGNHGNIHAQMRIEFVHVCAMTTLYICIMTHSSHTPSIAPVGQHEDIHAEVRIEFVHVSAMNTTPIICIMTHSSSHTFHSHGRKS